MNDNSANNISLITRFIDDWAGLDATHLVSYFCDDGIYHNMPTGPVKGRRNIEKFIEHFIADWRETKWEIVTIIGNGDTVIVERKDRTTIGNRTLTLSCTGIFIIDNGKIREWRDYFDMMTYIRGVGMLSMIKLGIRQFR